MFVDAISDAAHPTRTEAARSVSRNFSSTSPAAENRVFQ